MIYLNRKTKLEKMSRAKWLDVLTPGSVNPKREIKKPLW